MFKKKEKKAADPAAEKSAAKAEKTNKKKAKKNNQKKKPEPAPGSASGTVAGSIPYVQVYPNGIFELENGLFSVSYRIPDINFISVSEEKQEELIKRLNACSPQNRETALQLLSVYLKSLE